MIAFHKDNYHRRLTNIHVIDGDTIEASIDLGFGIVWETRGRRADGRPKRQRIRILDIDTPETTRRGSWDNGLSGEDILKVIKIGKRAKSFTTTRLGTQHQKMGIFVYSPGWQVDSLGRILAHVYYPDRVSGKLVSLSQELLKAHLAVPFETRKTTTPVTTLI